jgi:acyl-lipid Delta6-acetylenase / acyl-lipid (9-3)-desaturase
LAFIGHDIGHNSISHTQWNDTFFGILFGNTLGGIGLGWWKHSHNVHHVVCNSVQHDPDIQHMPLFAIADDIFDARKLKEGGCYNEEKNGFWSSFHQKYISPDIVSRFLVSNQHYLFYPIMAVARFNLYIQGWIFAFNAKHHDAWFAKRYQTMELLTLSTFLVWVSTLVCTLPLYERGLWLLLSHAFAGILHVQICISHFTMDVYHGHAYNDTSDEWFKMQCNTTMNVDCPRWMDFVHGGLQFQIEHHLFPRLPRHNLREARALVKPFCEKWKVKYHEKNFFDSNVELVNGLKSVAYKCRKYGLDSVGGFRNTQIYEGLNAEG